MLSDHTIRQAIDTGQLQIDPWDEDLLQPASVDLRLGRGFRVFRRHSETFIDPSIRQSELTDLVRPSKGQPFILHPGEFALAHTYERIRLGKELAGRIEGKSSLGRLGLQNHSTAGFIDPGFDGQVVLELSNVNVLPIKLWPGMKIGQLCLFRMASTPEQAYGVGPIGSRYQGQTGPQQSRSWKNWRTWDVE